MTDPKPPEVESAEPIGTPLDFAMELCELLHIGVNDLPWRLANAQDLARFIEARDAAIRADERQRAFADLIDWIRTSDHIWSELRHVAAWLTESANLPRGPGDGSGRRVE